MVKYMFLSGTIDLSLVLGCTILYLWRRQERFDRLAIAGANVGVVFCTLTLASGPIWAFRVADLEVTVVYDVDADRMRIIIPIGPAENIPKEELVRVMQANFDSALDARYAIANGMLWGTFVHPLSELSDEEFLVGLGGTANIVLTYGTSYSSGLLIFGGGDSAEMRRNLIEELRKERT
ncbi:MAG: type III secretion system chaperone [Acidobacteria bacterium]|nr:type III secretion system chaperone [Acidobacteriota bacterium]